MYEIDFLAVGDGSDSGDAIAMRFTHPVTQAPIHVIVDAGFQDDGDALVALVNEVYGTDHVDLAILTHPDRDHIGGMGTVVRELQVERLWLHDIGSHGGSSLPAATAVNDLISVARSQGTIVEQPWGGAQLFGGALTILGPAENYYSELVAEQVEGRSVAAAVKGVLLEAARGLFERISGLLADEVPFEAKEVTPRNNSSIITLLKVDGRTFLLTADAGVPALERAWDMAQALGVAAPPHFVQIPHHGSRRNCSSAWLDRLLGPTGQETGTRTAFVSVVGTSDKHPSGKVVNAYMRRGCDVVSTADGNKCLPSAGAPARPSYYPVSPLQPMIEEDD